MLKKFHLKNHFLILKQRYLGKIMNCFKKYFNSGHLIESFAVLPSISYNWMKTINGKAREVTFAWLFWYFSIGNIRIYLDKWK